LTDDAYRVYQRGSWFRQKL